MTPAAQPPTLHGGFKYERSAFSGGSSLGKSSSSAHDLKHYSALPLGGGPGTSSAPPVSTAEITMRLRTDLLPDIEHKLS